MKKTRESSESFFNRLTRVFKNGTTVKRKIRQQDTMIAVPDKTKSSGALIFQKSTQPTYANITSSAYNLTERLMRYQDFCEMEMTPEIASALDIYADETAAVDENGKSLHIYSDNKRIKSILEDLFYGTLNINFNLRPIARNLAKFGDHFLYNDIHPQYGVINAFPTPVNELEREENYDPEDPFAVRFRWVTLGNKILENWEISHMRLLGNDMFIPYGASVIEPARRIWRQLILIEDAMLVYRIVRAPERRVFYIDVANLPPDDVSPYVEQCKTNIRANQVIDRNSGRVDLRYNAMPVHKDTPIPLLDGRVLTIENLSKELNNNPTKDLWVYSIIDSDHQIVPGKVVWCNKNYTAKKLVKVWLDNNSFITTAPEHPFILRNGQHVRADQLSEGQALMPFYRRINDRGYEEIYNPKDESYESTHNVVCKNLYHKEFITTKYRTVHHKKPWENGNKLNNHPENLQIMTLWEHRDLHNKMLEHTLLRPEVIQANKERLIKYNKSEKKRQQTSELNKLNKTAEHMGEIYNGSELHKEHNKIRKEAQLKSWSENKQERCKAMRKWIVPEFLFDEVRKLIIDNPKIGYKRVQILLCQNKEFVEKLMSVQTNSTCVFKPTSYSCWLDILNERYENGYEEFRASIVGYKNHKITKIEYLDVEGEDVYCMTVVGPNGEDDRHNFATYTISENMNYTPSGVFVVNSIDEDYWLPVRGGESGTKIETLAGGQNTAAVEDVQYIQKKLFAALKIPKAYLGYEEGLSSKASLAQMDIRFSRTIQTIQNTIISEFNKLAMIHLYTHGYDKDDITNFTLKLSNPSTVAQQQKLEMIRAKFDIAGSAPENMVDRTYIQSQVLGLSPDDIEQINKGLFEDAKLMKELENAGAEESEGGGGSSGGGGFGDLFGGGGGEESGGGEEELDLGGGEEEGAAEEPEAEEEPIEAGADDTDNDESELLLSVDDPSDKPISKVNAKIRRNKYNRDRRDDSVRKGIRGPDFIKSTGNNNKSMKDVYDKDFFKSLVKVTANDMKVENKTILTHDVISTLTRMKAVKNIGNGLKSTSKNAMLTESVDIQDEIDSKNVDLPFDLEIYDDSDK